MHGTQTLCTEHLKRRDIAFNTQKYLSKALMGREGSCVTQTARTNVLADAGQQCHPHEYHLTAFIRLWVGRK